MPWRCARPSRTTERVGAANDRRRERPLGTVTPPKFAGGDLSHEKLREHLPHRLAHRLDALGDSFEASTWYEQHRTRDRIILRTAPAW